MPVISSRLRGIRFLMYAVRRRLSHAFVRVCPCGQFISAKHPEIPSRICAIVVALPCFPQFAFAFRRRSFLPKAPIRLVIDRFTANLEPLRSRADVNVGSFVVGSFQGIRDCCHAPNVSGHVPKENPRRMPPQARDAPKRRSGLRAGRVLHQGLSHTGPRLPDLGDVNLSGHRLHAKVALVPHTSPGLPD